MSLVGLTLGRAANAIRPSAANAASARFRRDYDADVVAPRLLSFLLETTPVAADDRN